MVLKPNEIAIYNKVEENSPARFLENAEDENFLATRRVYIRRPAFTGDCPRTVQLIRSDDPDSRYNFANYRITARFRDGEDLATILSVLHNAGYFNYSQNNKQIIITAKPD